MFTYSVESGPKGGVTGSWQEALDIRSNMLCDGEPEVLINVYNEQVYVETLWTVDQITKHSQKLKGTTK